MKNEQGEYRGGAFHDRFGRGRASGTLRLTREGLTFSNNQATVLLPMTGLKVELGGASDRLVFFRNPAEPAWSVFTPDRDILKDPVLQISPADLAAIRKTRSLGRLAWAAAAAVLVALAVSIVVLYTQRSLVSGWLASKVPAEQEAKLGELIAEQFVGTKRLLSESTELAEDWDALLAPLLAGIESDRYEYDIILIEDSVPNAFALPGGKIFVHSGLLLLAERPEEVLSVVAHEIAHVNLQHSMRSIFELVTMAVVVQAVFGDYSGVIALAAEGGMALLSKAHSRDAEREADEFGWRYMEAASLDPGAAVSMFQKLGASQEGAIAEDLEKAAQWISTHPSTDERIATMQQKRDALSKTYPPMAFAFAPFLERVRGKLINPESHQPETAEKEESDEHTH